MREFTAKVPRAEKRHAGASEAEQTPFSIRTQGVSLSTEFKRYVRRSLGRKLGRFANRIERLTARFEDVNGPRGGVDIHCKVKVVLSSLPSIVVDARADSERPAFDAAAKSATRAVRKVLDRAGLPRAASPKKRAVAVRRATPTVDPGSFIGRRVGRSAKNLRTTLHKPDRSRRDAIVDTAQPGVSATDRKAGGGSTARRNVKARTTRATAALEDSRKDRPSRKSTRRSANRTKSGNKQQAAAVRRTRSPKRRATKAKVGRGASS